MAIGDIYQVNIVGRLHGQTTINTFHYAENQVGAGSAEAALLTLFNAGVVSELKNACSAEWELITTTAQQIRPLPPLLPVDDNTAAGPGAVAGESLPTSVAVVVTKRTGFAGRAFRGRCYFAGVPVSQEVDSQISTAALLLWGDVASEMSQTLADSTWNFSPIVYHRLSGTGTIIQNCLERQILRNQRRRQVGKGI